MLNWRSDGKISHRVSSTLSPIMQVMKELAAGKEIIDMSQGIPFFPPPEGTIKNALLDIEGLHKYGPDGGDVELKEEISRKLSRDNTIETDPDTEIMVTSGANLGFFNAAASICDVGDEVLLLDPFYFNHRMTLDILGIKAKHIPTTEHFLPDPDLIRRSIGPRTKAIVSVSPNNPTGMTYPRSIQEELVNICFEEDIFLISDETYEGFEYGLDHFSPASFGPSAPVITLFSFSKNYSLSGWRIGYMVFPSQLHDGLLKVQDTTVICPPRISQRVALQCLKEHPYYLGSHIEELDMSRREIIKWLRKHKPVISCPEPNGAYYALPRVESKNTPSDSMSLVKEILDRTGVLLVPGTPFGKESPPHFRMAYGNISGELLRTALDRLDIYLEGI